MIGFAKKVAQVVFGNRRFQLPDREYVGTDSVLRLGPVDYVAWLNDVAGGGHIAGYATWQGAPTNIALMLPTAAAQGGGVASGYGMQPGQLYAPPAEVNTGNS